MLRRRVIPCLDVKDGRVVKGTRFVELVDEGDPPELAARYAAEGADELVFLDISAAPEGRGTLLEIVENSMSSEIYELMKRSDEAAVVEKAHRRPRFVEDCVREMIRGVIERLSDLGDDTFISARQENLETIHQHNVVAERFGLLGELRRELDAGHHVAHHTSMRDWLDLAA